jgi:uncharacterized protein (TIGR02646 family)
MIHVNRGPAPDGFREESTKWLSQFLHEQQSGQVSASQFWAKVRRRSSMRRYAQHLLVASHRKCAFCESRPESTSFLHIEHYRPKGNRQFENLMFDWENWLAACHRCNSRKWKHFPDCTGQPCLLDPASEDPQKHIEFRREVPLGRTRRGQETIKLIGLDRSPLTDERSMWLLTIDILLLLLLHCLVPRSKDAARKLLIWAMQPDAPYSAMTCFYLSSVAPKLANPATPHEPVNLDDPYQQIAELVKKHGCDLASLM